MKIQAMLAMMAQASAQIPQEALNTVASSMVSLGWILWWCLLWCTLCLLVFGPLYCVVLAVLCAPLCHPVFGISLHPFRAVGVSLRSLCVLYAPSC